MLKKSEKKTAKNRYQFNDADPSIPRLENEIDVEPIFGGKSPIDIEAIDLSTLGKEYKPRRKENMTLRSILLITGLVLLMALTALLQKNNLSFSFFSEESKVAPKSYLRVGPVTTTLANEDIIEFSVDIDCGNAKRKTKLAKKDSEIRDTIMSVLTTPGTEELIRNREYDVIKSKIKERLAGISAPIEDVYVAEILLY